MYKKLLLCICAISKISHISADSTTNFAHALTNGTTPPQSPANPLLTQGRKPDLEVSHFKDGNYQQAQHVAIATGIGLGLGVGNWLAKLCTPNNLQKKTLAFFGLTTTTVAYTGAAISQQWTSPVHCFSLAGLWSGLFTYMWKTLSFTSTRTSEEEPVAPAAAAAVEGGGVAGAADADDDGDAGAATVEEPVIPVAAAEGREGAEGLPAAGEAAAGEEVAGEEEPEDAAGAEGGAGAADEETEEEEESGEEGGEGGEGGVEAPAPAAPGPPRRVGGGDGGARPAVGRARFAESRARQGGRGDMPKMPRCLEHMSFQNFCLLVVNRHLRETMQKIEQLAPYGFAGNFFSSKAIRGYLARVDRCKSVEQNYYAFNEHKKEINKALGMRELLVGHNITCAKNLRGDDHKKYLIYLTNKYYPEKD